MYDHMTIVDFIPLSLYFGSAIVRDSQEGRALVGTSPPRETVNIATAMHWMALLQSVNPR